MALRFALGSARAAEETGLLPDLLKRDVARLLLAVEQAQAELAKPTEVAMPPLTLSPEEREQALAWLREPNLIGRLREAFHQAGIIGEETNTLVAYLAGVSRKLGKQRGRVFTFDCAETTPSLGANALRESVAINMPISG
ncbi:MAG TPA: hypothetical protein PLW35_03455 [Verrucomicrobiota bacterium]|nr:hypothetical protein [Verrucomicrobiota bacterium]